MVIHVHGCGILFLQNAENYSIPLLLLNFELLALEDHTPVFFSHLLLLPLFPTFLEGANNGKRHFFWGEMIAEALSHNHSLGEDGSDTSFMLQPV